MCRAYSARNDYQQSSKVLNVFDHSLGESGYVLQIGEGEPTNFMSLCFDIGVRAESTLAVKLSTEHVELMLLRKCGDVFFLLYVE